MDWGFDDILMGDFQIPPSPSISISQENLPNSRANKDEEGIFSDTFVSDDPMTDRDNNERHSPASTSIPKLSTSEPAQNLENESPDYVSELHQLLSEEDNDFENHMNVSTERNSQVALKSQSIIQNIDGKDTPFSIHLMSEKGSDRIENFPHFEIASNSRAESSSALPLLLSPPPAYRDDICELPFTASTTLSDFSILDVPNTTDTSTHSVLGVKKTPLQSQHSVSLLGSNTTISVGDTFLTISPASVASSPLTLKPSNSSSSNSQKLLQSLPFSITRLPQNILHSTTIKPAKSSSNSFSLLPITPPLTVFSTSTSSSSSNNSPLLLKALTPRNIETNTVTSVPSSPLSRCSITPITSSYSTEPTETESGSNIKALKSQSSLSCRQDPQWQNNVDLKDFVPGNERHGRQVISAPPSIEAPSTMQTNALKSMDISLPTLQPGANVKRTKYAPSNDPDSPNRLKDLPSAYTSTKSNPLSLANDSKLDVTNDFKCGTEKKETDQNFEAANKLAQSLEALQNSAMLQPGESSVELMNALSLSILPIHSMAEEVNNRQHPSLSTLQPSDCTTLRQSTSSTLVPISSSDLSLCSNNNFIENLYPLSNINYNSNSAKCPLNILTSEVTETTSGSTISIRPIWKEATSVGECINDRKSAWDSAVVAQLGTLRPCTPPPTTLKSIAKSSAPKGISASLLPPPPISLTPPLPPTRFQSNPLLNDDGSCSVPSSPQQPVGISCTILPPPPYSSALVASSGSFAPGKSSSYASATPTAMSEADSGVESIDSLSPKDISPISSPSTSTIAPSESMLSNCIIPPPPPASFSVCTNKNNTVVNGLEASKASNRCLKANILSEEDRKGYQLPFTKTISQDDTSNARNNTSYSSLENSLVSPKILDHSSRKAPFSSTSSKSTSNSVLSSLLSTVPKPTKSSELLCTLLNSSPKSSCIPSFSLSSSKQSLTLMTTSVDSVIPDQNMLTFPSQRSTLKRSISVVAINPNDMILSKEEKCKAIKSDPLRSTSIQDFIELGNGTFPELHSNDVDESDVLAEQPFLRSALEDMDMSTCRYETIGYPPMDRKEIDVNLCLQDHNKTNQNNSLNNSGQPDSIQTPKHGKYFNILNKLVFCIDLE